MRISGPIVQFRLATIVCVLLLMLSLVLDAVPRFTMGDSGSYLGTQIHGFMPDDRSWAYGLWASFTIRFSHDLSTVAVVQIMAVWLGAIFLAGVLVRYFRASLWYGVAAAAVLFVNPLSFFWARSFMTDTLAAVGFGVLVAVIFAERGVVVTALAVFVLAFLVCALRSVYLPPLLVAFCATAALCLLRAIRATLRHDSRAVDHRRAALRYAALAIAVLIATGTYAWVNSKVLHRSYIATNYATTRFLVSAWSPLMGEPFAALGLPSQVSDHMLPLTYSNRLGAAFMDDGIVERLRAYFGSHEAAAPVHKRLLWAALVDRPVDFLALIARSWSDYINPDRVLLYHRDMRLTGTNGWGTPDTLPPDLIERLESWGIWHQISPTLPQVRSIGLLYYAQVGGYWALLVSIHATLAVLLFFVLPRRNRTDEVLAIQLFALAYMAMIALTTNALVTRYLIPMDIPLLITVGAIVGRRSPDPIGP